MNSKTEFEKFIDAIEDIRKNEYELFKIIKKQIDYINSRNKKVSNT